VYAVKVKRGEAQEKLEELRARGDYDGSRKPSREGKFVFLPVKRKLEGAVEKELHTRRRRTSLKREFGISSFDVVGDVAVILIPREQWKDRGKIAARLMSVYPHLKSVFARTGVVSGEFRLPQLELIAGAGSETVHVENGLEFRLDVTKAYFSPRQSSERKQLTEYVKKGDVAAVFFAGIGPIPVYFSKFTGAREIYALEANPDAVRYMKENIRINRCENVEVLGGDVRQRFRDVPPCDLVVLPLPMGSWGFAEEAAAVLKEGGRAIFYVGSKEEELESKLSKVRKLFGVDEVRKEIQIAPRVFRFVVHARRK
jgi:tRNA (guanine37-N1)-methyltransferase